MYVIAVLMGASLLVAGGFLLAYWWAVRNGQYDDLYTPSVRMLFDDDPPDPVLHNAKDSSRES